MALGPMIFLHRDAKWHESNKRNQAFVEPYVDRALDRKKRRALGDLNGHRPVLLDLMAEEMDDRVRLRNEALHAFIAAHETTGSLNSTIIFILARHPDIFTKLRNEALAIEDSAINFDTCIRIRYLSDVINESKLSDKPHRTSSIHL